MKAPKSKSFLSKACDVFRRKPSRDECFCDKSKSTFPSGISPVSTKPIRYKGPITSPAKKNRHVFQEISQAISANPNRDPGIEQATYASGRLTGMKNYWCYWAQPNNATENKWNTGDKDVYEDEEEEEGVFTIQVGNWTMLLVVFNITRVLPYRDHIA